MAVYRARLNVAVHTVYGRVIALSVIAAFIIYLFVHFNYYHIPLASRDVQSANS